MPALTEAGRKAVAAAAARHGVSEAAAEAMLRAVVDGGGTMAQFNIPELGGSGQWMAGGMTMVGDMFNHGLQAKVAGLAADLSQAMNAARLVEPPPAATARHGWWPEDLGQPSATGNQNDFSYAVFPAARRLAVRAGDRVFVFDTLDHRIGGVSQSQSGGGLSALSFQSQGGSISLVELPRVDVAATTAEQQKDASPAAAAAKSPAPEPKAEAAPPAAEPRRPAELPRDVETILRTIERLAELRDKGALTDADYDAKKKELLAQI